MARKYRIPEFAKDPLELRKHRVYDYPHYQMPLVKRLMASREAHEQFMAASRFHAYSSRNPLKNPSYDLYLAEAAIRNKGIQRGNLRYRLDQLLGSGVNPKSARLSANVFLGSKPLMERMRFANLMGSSTGISSTSGSPFPQGAFSPNNSPMLSAMARFYRKQELASRVIPNAQNKVSGLAALYASTLGANIGAEKERFRTMMGRATSLSSIGGSAFPEGTFEPRNTGILSDMARFYRKRELKSNVLKLRFENLMNKAVGLSSIGGSAFQKGIFDPIKKGGALSAMAQFYRKQELQQNIISNAQQDKIRLFSTLASAGVFSGGDNAQVNKAEKTISGGIQKAFGGKDKLTAMMKGFGVGHLMAGTTVIGLVKKFLWDMPLASSQMIRSTYQGAMLSGATPQQMSGLGYAIQSLGGQYNRAGALYGQLNQLYTGAKFGAIPQQFLTLAQRYKIPFMGSSGIATPEQYIETLSNRLQTSNAQSRADIAHILGLSGSELELLSGGYGNYRRKVEQAGVGSIFEDPERAKKLKEFSNAVDELSVEFSKAKANMSIALTGLVKTISGFLSDVNIDLQSIQDIKKSPNSFEWGTFFKIFLSDYLDRLYRPNASHPIPNPIHNLISPLVPGAKLIPDAIIPDFLKIPTSTPIIPTKVPDNSTSMNTNISIDLRGLDGIISPNTRDKWNDALVSTMNDIGYTNELIA